MKKIFTLFIGAILMTSACVNLDERTYSEMPKDEFLSSGENLALYTSTPYTRLQDWAVEQGYWTLILQLCNEMAVPKDLKSGYWAEPRYGELHSHEIPAGNKLVKGGWEFCFNGIAACNDALHEIEKTGIKDEAALQNIAEIRVLRAFYYFLAVDLWGNVPFSISKTDTSSPKQKPRKEMFSFIETEIKESINDLSEKTSSTYGRVTKDVANFLLAKLYLNAEVYIGEDMYEEAGNICKDIMDGGKYQLTATYKENFDVKNENSTEAIFAIPYSNVYTPEKFFIWVMSINSYIEPALEVGGTWNGSWMGQPDFMATYAPEDTRKKDTWLFGEIYDRKGTRVQYQDGVQCDDKGQPITDENGNHIPIMYDLYLEDINIPESKFGAGIGVCEGARIQKWTYQGENILIDNNVSMENDFFLMRYADVVLMYIECLVRQGQAGLAAANEDFQKIRTRAGLEPIAAADLTLDNLLIERQHELALETWTRNDLVRFGKYLDAWWAKDAGQDYMLLLPIPSEMIGSNPNLGQNDGY